MTVFITIWFFMVVLGLTAVGALVWAIQSGQLKNISSGAKSIFDDDEPIGATTDSFPSKNQNQPRSEILP